LLQSETDAGGPIAVDQYVWSVTYIDAPVGRWHDDNGDGDYLDYTDDGQANDDWVRYFTRDGNQNVTAAVEGTFDTGSQQWQWQLAERYVYTPYGEATVYDADWSNPAAPTTDGPLYCGYFFDAETALYHVRHRYYHPTLSIWLTRDPLGYLGGGNLYEYVGGNPTGISDPLGLLTPATHARATYEAICRAIEQGTFDVGKCDVDEFKEALVRGAINPDFAYVPAGATGIDIDWLMTFDEWNEWLGSLTEPIENAVWEAGKWVVSWVPPVYNGLRWVRNWWQDTSILEPVVEGAAEVYPGITTVELYRTHFGDKAWQHAMATAGLSAKQIQDKLVGGAASFIEQFRRDLANEKCCEAAFALGQALHYLQDSWTESHTRRDAQGRIELFQDYSLQSPTLHARKDFLRRGTPQFEAQVARSIEFLRFASSSRLSGEALREEIRRRFFPLAPKLRPRKDTLFQPRL